MLHLISTLEKAGGAQRLLLSILPGLSGYRHELAVLSGALELRAEFEAIGVPVHDKRTRSLLDPFGIREVRSTLRDGGHALVHCHLSRAEIVGGFAARPLPGVKVLLFKQNDDAWWRRPHLKLAHKRICRRADSIVCTSDAVKDFFARLEPSSAGKLTRIHNGIDVESIASAAAEVDVAALRRSLGVPEGRAVILAVGRLVEQKGHDVLVRAMRDVSGAVAVLVGRGENEETLKTLARELGIADRMIFAGYRADVPALMGACDVLAMPSRWEGFGLAAAEAMAAGKPVVASRVSALPEVVEDGVSGTLVPAGDAPALAAALGALVADAGKRAAFGAAGLVRVRRLFGRERMLSEWRAEYARLVP